MVPVSLLTAVAVLALVGGALLWVRHAVTTAYGEALAAASGDIVLEAKMANNFGRTSAGVTQVRGNGALLLTTEAVVFTQLSPRRTTVIPLSSVTGVERVRKHLTKPAPGGGELIKVDFETEDGPDAMAFLVGDPARWERELLREVGRGREGAAEAEAVDRRAAAARRESEHEREREPR